MNSIEDELSKLQTFVKSLLSSKVNIRIARWSKDTSQLLDLSHCKLREFPEILVPFVDRIIELDCSFNLLETLIVSCLPNCKILKCNNNSFGISGQNDRWFDLPDLPKCQLLYCDNNFLSNSLPPLPECIELWCDNNKLKTLSEVKDSLQKCKKILCSNNRLILLVPAGVNLPLCTILKCFDNKLCRLPKLFICEELVCFNNKLVYLPCLKVCISLICSRNQLIKLPPLKKCVYIDCSNNNITKFNLPDFPQCKIFCDNNKFNELHTSRIYNNISSL